MPCCQGYTFLNHGFHITIKEKEMNTNRIALVLTVTNFIILLVILLQGRMISTQTIPDTLRVRTLQLVDENGEVRAQLNVSDPGNVAVFRMMDQEGTIRVKLGASEEGSGLVLLNELTEPGVHILAQEDNTSLTITNQSGAIQVIKP
jgi:hypothetical protein